ncbi:MAG TPA: hypothetical protein VLD62_10585 [Acidimicrobiia bacterium]|nr:hypothetical protein [Acidimicrobiia bacterium]
MSDYEDGFEPFVLDDDDSQVEEESPRTRTIRNQVPNSADDLPPRGEVVACPSCHSHNPPYNRHCEACGARIDQAPMPVAPQPMLRTTAGARALMVLAGVIFTVAVLALAVNVFRGDEDSAAVSSSTTTTTQPTLNIVQLQPIRVRCSSELPSFPCSALIDDDETNSWNATEGGIGTEITFLFSPPVQITEMFVHNLEEEERFLRNARIKGITVTLDDLQQATVTELDDSNEPQRIQLRSLRTSSVTIKVDSAYPGQTFDGREPFRELAAQEILFYGRVAPDISG